MTLLTTTPWAGASASVTSRLASWRVFGALLARDVYVLRRNLVAIVLQVAVQPLLFVFAFAYVMPRIGQAPGGDTFATVLVPGMVALTVTMQAVLSVTAPLPAELGPSRHIHDRALAPLPLWALGAQKIVSSALFALISAAVVFPIVLFVHAPGYAPSVRVDNWALFALTLGLCAVLAASLGLLLGTVVDTGNVGVLFGFVMTPTIMLGCVYYPWAALGEIRWLQVLTLLNPLVYMSEGLRANLTPGIGHMPAWAYLSVLVLGSAAVCWLALRQFSRRVRG